ncbi:MAG: phosphate/phosphite/phosphonate ABC transporter substrate-binding protein [Alphaproteobacteria bacterium]|nr:MAG: phosphate/phosphite/phosphonate ABC transporter substrate-binding protein [Alphaproteobacteria bacterium]
MGRISSKPARQYRNLDKLNRAMVDAMSDFGIGNTQVRIARNAEHMRQLLEAELVDYLSETVFTAVALEKQGVADIVLREWKGGVPTFYSLILVRKSSDLQTVADLAGRSIVFEDSGSTSGFYLPYLFLRNQGLDLHAATSGDSAPSDSLQYSFGGDETTVLARVIRGKADAGAISNLEWLNDKKVPAVFRENLRILARTEPITRSVVLVRRTLPAELKKRIVQTLLALGHTESGRAVLQEYFGVTRFDTIDDSVRTQLARVGRAHSKYFQSPTD